YPPLIAKQRGKRWSYVRHRIVCFTLRFPPFAPSASSAVKFGFGFPAHGDSGDVGAGGDLPMSRLPDVPITQRPDFPIPPHLTFLLPLSYHPCAPLIQQ